MEYAKTTFKGITIIHPHSGKVSRSVVQRCLANYFGYEDIPTYGIAYLKDANNQISLNDYFEGQEDKIILACNVKKGEAPSTRNGTPYNYYLVGFLSEESYNASLKEAWKNGRNLIKTDEFLEDHVLCKNSKIMSTRDYLDDVYYDFGNEKPSSAVYRIIKKGIYPFNLNRAKKEIQWCETGNV